MTKADIVSEIAKSTGVEKVQVQAIVEAFMDSIKTSLTNKNNVYLRGFGSFIVKKRAKKVARNKSIKMQKIFSVCPKSVFSIVIIVKRI